MTTHHTDHHPTGAELLDATRAALTRYVSLPSAEAADAVVLWIAATHAQPAWAHAPRLVIRAPEKRCGKSRLLDVIEATCHNPFITVNSSSAAVYRSISEDPPTMLVDEADTIFGPKADGNEDLRGLLNAGHQRNRPAKRYDAAANRVESIPTFAMAALAGIGAMPDTIEDRAVIIRMRRRAPGETVAPFRHRRDRPVLRAIAGQLASWLRADLTALEAAQPAMPVEDRAADTWEPLVIVADHAGCHWPDRARAAVLALTAAADENGEQSIRLRLLTDCHAAFDHDTALPTSALLTRLKHDPEAPWATYGPTGLTAAKLGALLREYDIRSANIRFPDGTQAKGYQRTHFDDAWTRYCPNLHTSEASQPSLPRSARDAFTVWDGTDRPKPTPDEVATRRINPSQHTRPSQRHQHRDAWDDRDTHPPAPNPRRCGVTTASPDVAALLAQVVQLLASEPSATVPEPRPTTTPDRVLLTVEEAAARLRIGRTTTWGLVRAGELRSVQIGRLRRIPASVVDAYAIRLLADNDGGC